MHSINNTTLLSTRIVSITYSDITYNLEIQIIQNTIMVWLKDYECYSTTKDPKTQN
jgi:hypothetical protein